MLIAWRRLARTRGGRLPCGRRRMRTGVYFIVTAVGALAAGCSEPTGPRTVTNPNLPVRVAAIKDAVRRKDLSVAPELVKQLDSDDPAERFYAIEGLRRLNGDENFGYRFY